MTTSRRSSWPRTAARLALGCLLLLGVQSRAWSDASIAVLDFELKDLTLLPNGPEEVARTASIRPMLEEALRTAAAVRIIAIEQEAARDADAGVGYLFEHSEAAARLGASGGADWILVGRLHKPSFLFAYLMARLVDTGTGKVAEDLLVEIKGQQDVVTRKGVERLAKKIAKRLQTEASVPER